MINSIPKRNASLFRPLNRRGSALVIVLLLVSMITALVVEFAYEIYADTSSTDNWVNAQRASLIAKSGQTFSSEFLKEVNGYKYTYTRDVSLPVPLDFGRNSHLILKVEDEKAKLNINKVTQTKYFNILKRLLEYLNIDPDLAYSVADWIDTDSDPRLGNSEDNAKNSLLWSLDELQYIDGMSAESFEKLRPFLTVHGDGLININTAQLPVLISLHAEMTETLAQNIIDYREYTPFEDTDSLKNVSGMSDNIRTLLSGFISVKSDCFRISSIATSNNITRTVESVMDTSLNVHYWREG
jgi:general secretion pathway protein K